MKKIRMTLLAAAPMVLVLALVGCGAVGDRVGMPGMDHGRDDQSRMPSAEVSGDFNQADAMFAMMMIPHHEQAVEMSDLILAKPGVPQEVSDLAEQIKAAQAPEIELMRSWLEDWGMDMPGAGGGMGHGDGMMSDDDMAQLEAADGAVAWRLFLEQMIEHHEGAIDMAQSELERGVNEDALELAERIIQTQTAEIATMERLLAE